MLFRSGLCISAVTRLPRLLGSALLALVCGAGAAAQNVTTVTNVFQNHYRYGYTFGTNSCPSGYTIDSSQYANSPAYGPLHLERGHAMHHVDTHNADNDYWVYWAHLDSSNYALAEAAVFKSKAECGPYILQSQAGNPYSIDGSGYGLQPGGWQFRDDNIFRDSATQTYNPDGSVAAYAGAYVIAASNDLGTQTSPTGGTCNYANDSMAIFKMTPDYLGIDASTNPATHGANWVFVCGQREAPVMFRQGSKYFLITSQAAGWYPSQGGYGVSGNPLTGWSPSSLNLGNASTFGGQTSDGFTVEGTEATTYILAFDHLGGDDSKNPAYASDRRDTGGFLLPVLLDGNAGTATLPWSPSFSVDNTTGVLTLPTLTNLALSGSASSTVVSAASSGSTTYVPGNAIDGSYATRWQGSATGSASFAAAKPTNTSVLCPVTNATTSTTCNPSLVADLGSVQPVQQIDLSWYMVKGSEPYYTFKINYSSDGSTWNTLDYTTFAPGAASPGMNLSSVPFSTNNMYGFNSLPVNFSARYVALLETSVVQQNSPSPFYGPNVFEMAVYRSTAPAAPAPVTVTVTPSNTNPSPSTPFTVAVSVSGPAGQPVPSGYVQLSGPGYTSETYGLVNGGSSFSIPAGALTGGAATISVGFRADPTSAPVYGIGTTTGSAPVSVSTPDAPTGLTLTRSAPAALTDTWTAAPGATSYVIRRSSDGGNTYTQVGSAMSTSFTDSGLANDSTSYCYTVASVNAAGVGGTTIPACSTATAEFPVTGITVVQSGPGALTISYAATANATGYILRRSINNTGYTTLPTTTSTSYIDSGLATGSYACYTVAAVFSTGTASDSAQVCGNVMTGNAPMGVTVTRSGNGQLTLAWTSSSTTSTSYVIKRSVNGSTYSTLIPSQPALTYVDTGLTNYTNTYCYVVEAVLNGVTSPDSLAACNSPGFFLTVPNYSFELPSTTSYFYNPPSTSASWTFTASGTAVGSGVTTNSSGFTAGNAAAPAGSQVAFLQGLGSVTQVLNGFIPGQAYQLAVAASQRQNKSGGQLGNPLNVILNGTTVVTVTAPQASTAYSEFRAPFTATAGSETLQLAGTNGLATPTYSDNTVFIDNVRISAVGTAAAPITVQPMTIAQGTASAVLTASRSFGGTAPDGLLIFQVNGGDQVASTCTANGGSQVCTATYPTGTLPLGSATITAAYPGDASYAGSSGAGTLTVNDASTGSVQLVAAAPLSRLSDGSYQAVITVMNNGTTTAKAVSLSSVALGSTSASGVPASLGDIAPGGSASLVVPFPATAGNSGGAVVEQVKGSYTGGTFGSSLRARLP